MSLATSLTRLGLDHQLAWWQVQRILDLAKAETDQAVEGAISDHVRFHPDHARHIELVYQTLKTAPYRRSAYYEPRNFATFEHTPEQDFASECDARHVDPADVPHLPALAGVRSAS